MRVISAYFPNGQAPGSDKFEYKMEWLSALRRWVKDELVQHPKLVLMGTTTSPLMTTMCGTRKDCATPSTAPRRSDHLRALIALGLHDSLRLFPQPSRATPGGTTATQVFAATAGCASTHSGHTSLKPMVTGCAIDKLPRKNERPSDHAPVVVELNAQAWA